MKKNVQGTEQLGFNLTLNPKPYMMTFIFLQHPQC